MPPEGYKPKKRYSETELPVRPKPTENVKFTIIDGRVMEVEVDGVKFYRP